MLNAVAARTAGTTVKSVIQLGGGPRKGIIIRLKQLYCMYNAL